MFLVEFTPMKHVFQHLQHIEMASDILYIKFDFAGIKILSCITTDVSNKGKTFIATEKAL